MLPQHKMILLLQYLAIIEFAKWRRRQCKQMAFTRRKNIIFNPNSKQHLRFRLKFCYLTLGMYDTPNSFGHTDYVYSAEAESHYFLHNALQFISVLNLRYASLYPNFYRSPNFFNNVEGWTLGWPR